MENMSGANGFASSVEKELGTHDSLDKVKQCLNCTRDDCSNCLSYRTKPIPEPSILREKVQELYFGQSMEIKEISVLLGVRRGVIDKHVREIRKGGMIQNEKT